MSEIDVTRQLLYDLQRVSRAYGQGSTEVVAVREATCEIASGESVAIVGQSGSGKTTLLQLLGGIDRPTSGALFFEGRDMAKLKDADLTLLRLETIGFVFQQFNLIPTLTAGQNVEAALAPRGLGGAERRERAAALLASVGLEDRAVHLPTQLSGGEQQRVAIARALANDPRVLLADEPTGNLDSETGAEILGLLRSLAGGERTVIIVTHDREIAATAERVIRMRDGAIVGSEAAPAQSEPTAVA
jgi:putative ABC transport system ATP-binding protein